MSKLPPAMIELAKKHKPVFVRAEELTGVPWQMICAVSYRENNLSSRSPVTPGGPYQFDPIPASETLHRLLKSFTKGLTDDQANDLVKKGTDDFEAGAVFCACWLRLKAHAVLTPAAKDEDVKDSFLGYNGRAYKSPDSSPYVMNNFDAAHKDMRLRGTIPDGEGGRRKIDVVDQKLGAFTVYKALKDLGL